MKKKLMTGILICLMLLAALMKPQTVMAATASFQISASSTNVKPGESVTFTVSFSSDVSANCQVKISSSGVSFTKSTDFVGTGALVAPTVNFTGTVTGTGTITVTVSSVDGSAYQDPDAQAFSVPAASINISSAAETQTQPQTPAQTQPPAQTPAPATTISNAEQSRRDESIAAESRRAQSIAESQSVSVVQSIAESSRIAQSILEESLSIEALSTEEESTDEETTAPAVDILGPDGQTLDIVRNLEEIELPEGFSRDVQLIGGEDVSSAINQNGLILLRMKDGDAEGWYIYDAENHRAYPYVVVETAARSYVFLDPGTDPLILLSLERVTLTIDGINVTAFKMKSMDDPDLYIVYVMNEEGDKGFYRYDAATGEMLRYVADVSDTGPTSGEGVIVDESMSDLLVGYQHDASVAVSQLNDLNSQYDSTSLSKIVWIIALAIIILLLILVIAVLVVKLKDRGETQMETEDQDQTDSFPKEQSSVSKTGIRVRPRDSAEQAKPEESQDDDLLFDDLEEPETVTGVPAAEEEPDIQEAPEQDSAFDFDKVSELLSDVPPAQELDPNQKLFDQLDSDDLELTDEELDDDDFEIIDFK